MKADAGPRSATGRSLPDLERIAVADLYGDTAPALGPNWRDTLPGLCVALSGTLAAGFIADRYGAPLTLMALLTGLALNFLSEDRRLEAGLTFASRTLLRWAIVLTGLRVTLGQIAALGPVALLAVVIIVTLVVLAGLVASRCLGRGTAFGVLAGGAVAICGASAAMAIATTLGERRAGRHHLAMVLIGISALSAMAMVLYPIVAHLLHFDDRQAGFLLGAAIHDVAQSLGAGFGYSDGAGRIATIVKLARVALLAPVLAIIAAMLPEHQGKARLGLPWFVTGFLGLVVFNSLVAIPPQISTSVQHVSTGLLALAVTSVAIRSPLSHLREMGWRSMLVIVVPTIAAFLLALAFAKWMPR